VLKIESTGGEGKEREREQYTEKKDFFFYSLLRESKVGYIGA
jgi:hypothetical protein